MHTAFDNARDQLDAFVLRHKPAIEGAGISIRPIAADDRESPKTPYFFRYTFKKYRSRGDDICTACVSISVENRSIENVTIWTFADIHQTQQVAWWDSRQKTTLPFSDLLAMNLTEFVINAIEYELESMRAPVRTTSPKIAALLYELCVEAGFCLPRPATENLLNNPLSDLDEFTDAIFQAEGMNPHANLHLRAGVRALIQKYINP